MAKCSSGYTTFAEMANGKNGWLANIHVSLESVRVVMYQSLKTWQLIVSEIFAHN